jgi:hypothetical protein
MTLTSKIRIYSKAWFAFYNKDRHSNERRRVCDHSTIWALEILGEQACIQSKPQPKRATSFHTGQLSKKAALQVFEDLANNPQHAIHSGL